MDKVALSKVAIVAFLAGLLMPFAISVLAMLVNFDSMVTFAKVAIPLSSINGIDDGLVIFGNGVIYAMVAVPLALACKGIIPDK